MTAASETICGEKPVYRLYELKNQKLVTFSYNKRQEYSELIKIVYNYALGNATEYELVIGNIMRQMLEAFFYISVQKRIRWYFNWPKHIALLPEDVYKTYLKI